MSNLIHSSHIYSHKIVSQEALAAFHWIPRVEKCHYNIIIFNVSVVYLRLIKHSLYP